MGVIDLSTPDLPDIDVPPPPASPAVSAGARSDGRMPAAAKAPPALVTAFESAALKYDIPLNIIMALGEQESRYNPGALGTPTQWGRAKGLMQFLDSTAARLGINPFDPIQSIDAAAMQLRDRLNRGYSMADAVKEHFAGPDRKKWGSKTARYGEEVLARAARLKGELAPRYAGLPPSGGPWYAPGAEKGAGSGEVSADAISAVVGKPSRAKPTSLADTIENPNDLRNIIARRESEGRRKPDEAGLSEVRHPEGTFGNALAGAATSSGEALKQAGQGIRMQFEDAAGPALDRWIARNMPNAPGLSLEGQREAFGRTNTQADFERSQARANAATPQFESWWADAAYGGLQSLIQTTPGVAAGIVMGPAAGLSILGGQTQAQSYAKYRARGASPGMALAGGAGEGIVEAGTEMIPMGWLADKFGKVGLRKFLSE